MSSSRRFARELALQTLYGTEVGHRTPEDMLGETTARIDGLSEWRIIVRVLLPLSKPAIATNVILSFIWSWNNFLWPLLITRDPEMQTLPLGLAPISTAGRRL